jgi:hypothetical protein
MQDCTELNCPLVSNMFFTFVRLPCQTVVWFCIDTCDRHPRSYHGHVSPRPYVCSRLSAQVSCIYGCYNCADTYGRFIYNMSACCQRCRETGSALVDDGPDQCSSEFIIVGDGAANVRSFAKGISVVRRHMSASRIADEYNAKYKASHKSRSNIADLWWFVFVRRKLMTILPDNSASTILSLFNLNLNASWSSYWATSPTVALMLSLFFVGYVQVLVLKRVL